LELLKDRRNMERKCEEKDALQVSKIDENDRFTDLRSLKNTSIRNIKEMIPRHTVIKLLKVSEMRKSEKQPK
jgi:hypothetical protein